MNWDRQAFLQSYRLGMMLCIVIFPRCVVAQLDGLQFDRQDSGTTVSLRAISVVDGETAWASGENGTVLRTIDGGQEWRNVSVPKAEGLDFRSLHAFDAGTAIAISAGSPALAFRTSDGGNSWQLVYENSEADVFVDAVMFWDTQRGLAYGDPLDGRLFLLATEDGGATWQLQADTPLLWPGEAGFAASCSSLVACGDRCACLGLGGAAPADAPHAGTARILRSSDGGETWESIQTPLAANASSGIFSIAAVAGGRLVAVGGDYRDVQNDVSNVMLSDDAGRTWTIPTASHPRGYRSCVAAGTVEGQHLLICVGTTGSDLSVDDGQTWLPLGDHAFHAIRFAADGKAAWAVGPDGHVARLAYAAAEGDAPQLLAAFASESSSAGDSPGTASQLGERLPRVGDEIVVCGQLFHTTTPVVLWMDPGGYDAYRVERRFAPYDQASWERSQELVEVLETPNRYNLRESTLTPTEIERVRGGGWDLALLQEKVDQFVIHYDVCGTSQTCFKVLQDMRGLSVHFMLDIDGTIYQTLDLKERAWHATKSNSRSIGIEIANIGAYPPDDMRALNQWYAKEADGNVRITLPERFGDGGVRTPNFVGRPLRNVPVKGIVQGVELVQYDLTEPQYEALARLTATLCRVLPRIRCDVPRDEQGQPIPRQLTDEQWENYSGLLGHYHVQKNKTDPGPAFQWEKVLEDARRLMAN